MKRKTKILLISAFAIVLLTTVFLTVFFTGRKLTVVSPAEKTDSVGTVVNLKAKTGLLLKEKNTEWYVNGWLCGQGASVRFPLNFGENIVTARNGKQESTMILTGNLNPVTAGSGDDYLFMPDGFSQGERLLLDEASDYDNDGLSKEQEKRYGTNPYLADTDGDGLEDGPEIDLGTDPLVPDAKEKHSYTVHGENSALTVHGLGNISRSFLKEYEAVDLGFDTKTVLSKILQPVRNWGIVADEGGAGVPDEDYSLKIAFPTSLVKNKTEVSVYEYNENRNEIRELTTVTSSGYYCAETCFGMYCFLAKSGEDLQSKLKNQILFCIDQSPSMYSPDFLKTTKDYSDSSDFSDCNQDPEYKRLDLVGNLVDALGSESIEYRVDVFWGGTLTVCDWTNDTSTVRKALEAERDAYHGASTELYDAIRKSMDAFDSEYWGIKQVIVLTDGRDTGWISFPVSQSTVQNYASKGKRISAIALGDNADKEYLQNLAEWSGGQYLFAPDAEALESLITPLKTMMSGQSQVGEETDGYRLIACSGFSSAIDGFAFQNFGSAESAGGNCYGMSQTAKAIFLGVRIPDAISEKVLSVKTWLFKDGMTIDVPAFSVTDSNRSRLKKGVTSSLDVVIPTLENNPNGWYLGTNNCVRTAFPIASSASLKNYDDLQVLQIISRYQLLQNKDEHLLPALLGRAITQSGMYGSELDRLIDEVRSGSPALLGVHCSLGWHAVLVTDVWKATDSEQYLLKLYDSNYPMESRMVNVSFSGISYTSDGMPDSRFSVAYSYGYDAKGTEILFDWGIYNGVTNFDYNVQ